MIDLSDTAERIQALIESAGIDATIYWSAAEVPAAPPDTFVVIEPLYASVYQAWGKNIHGRHTIQVRACARTVGETTKLANDVFGVLPATEFEPLTVGPLIKVGSHYDMILTPQTHAVGGD